MADEAIDYGHADVDAPVHGTAERKPRCRPVKTSSRRTKTPYYMWRERQLPANVDPLQSNLKDEEERRRLAKKSSTGDLARRSDM